MLVTRHAEAEAVLADPRYVPPPVRQDGAEGTLAWLRARVSRFSTGEAHARRRRELVALLDGLAPTRLRREARALTRERDGAWRGVPTAVLGAALGVGDTRAVPVAAAGYLSGEETPQADAAVAELLELAGLPVITLLLQGHAATEALVENALRHARPGDDVDALLHETLRGTRRSGPPAGWTPARARRSRSTWWPPIATRPCSPRPTASTPAASTPAASTPGRTGPTPDLRPRRTALPGSRPRDRAGGRRAGGVLG
ncbi:hypothetical protein ACFQYP_38650 [Nonomuraea antimicrobica]